LSEVVVLACLVAIPVLIPVIVIVAVLGTGSWWCKRFTSALTLSADEGLSSQGLLWLSIFCPFLYFIILGFVAWQGSEISITGEGLNTFFSLSKLPLAIVSLTIPLSVLVSRFHATKQTAEQNKITRLKNNLDLYSSHRNELFSYFSQIDEVNYSDCFTAKFKVHPRVHKNFFIGSPTDGTPISNESSFEDIERELSSARLQLDVVITDKNPKYTYDFYIANLCSTIYRLSHKLGLPEIYETLAEKSILVLVVSKKGRKELLTVGTMTDEIVYAYRYAKGYYENLWDFAGRESEKLENESLKYIDAGGRFKSIKEENVIENLHQTKIKEVIASDQA
tara:strand:- start:1004 stop:2011 length:1008 start_codon:yes stop_codon:yes gene_type:complete